MSGLVLTDRAVKELPLPEKGQREIFDTKVRGFGVRLTAQGSRTYFAAYRFAGKTRRLTIGPAEEIRAEKARRKAEEARGLARHGVDPLAQQRDRIETFQKAELDRTQTMTVRMVVDAYFEKRVIPDRLKSADELRRDFERHVIKPWCDKSIREIDRLQIIQHLDKIKTKNKKGVQANRVLSNLKTMFTWARNRGYVDENPCEGIEKPTSEKPRDRVLSDAELKAIWQASEELSPPFRAFVQMLVLCGQRKKETAEATWGEFDLDSNTWTIPGSRTKNRRTHKVPLPAPAIQILSKLRPSSAQPREPAFSTNGDVPINEFVRTKLKIDLASGVREWTLHDLRRTMASGMARLKVLPHVIEKILNHTPKAISGVAAVYNTYGYDDEKREALATWAQFVLALAQPTTSQHVLKKKVA